MKSTHDQRTAPPAHATGAVEFVPLADVAGDETFQLRAAGDVAQLATSMGRLGQLVPIELRPWPAAGGDGPCWQVVAGFRRLAAVRLLARERVLARLHRDLPDLDAWDLAVGEALLEEPLTGGELQALRERLRATGVAPWADELIDEALVRAPVSPELRERFHDFLAAPPGPSGAAEPPPIAPERAAPSEPLPATAEPAHAAEAVPVGPGDGPSTEIPGVQPATFSPDEIVEVTPEELVHDLTARLYALNQDLMTAFEAWEELPVEGRRLLVEQARYVAALLPFMEAKR